MNYMRYNLLATLLLFLTVHGLPTAFFQGYNPKTNKAFSIIGEFHDSHAIMPVYSSWESFYSSSEKSFIHALSRLDQQSAIPTDICWEVPDDKRTLKILETYATKKISLKKFGLYLINNNVNFSFLTFAPCQLITTLKRIRFINSDQLRIKVFTHLPDDNTSFDNLKKNFSSISMKSVQADFKDIMQLTNPMLHEQIKKLSQRNSEDSATCMYLWKAMARKMTIFYNQYLSGDEKRSVYETFKNIFVSTTKMDKYKDDYNAILSDLFDLETTLNILNSNAQHSIIYAGAGHVLRLASILQDSFGYNPVINIYQQTSLRPSMYTEDTPLYPKYLALPKQTWQYLNNPHENYTKYAQNPLIIEYPKQVITDFVSVLKSTSIAELKKIIIDNPDKELVNLLLPFGSLHITPLHFAAIHNKYDLTILLLSHGANIFADTFPQNDTPLHTALGFNNLDIAKKLVEVGSNLKSPDKQGKTPIEMAQKIGNKDLVELMVKKIEQYDKANQLVQVKKKAQESIASTSTMEQ